MDVFTMDNLQVLIQQISAWGLKVLGGVAILVAGLLVARLGGNAARRVASASLDATLADFLGKLAYYTILSVIAIMVCGIVGIETASLITVLGASSLAIGLALQGSLSNLASGVMMFVFRPFRIGDYVEIGDDTGFVAEMGVFSSALDTLDNVRIVLPNAHIAERPIRNWSTHGTRRLDLEIEIAVDSNAVVARGAIDAALRADERVLSEPAPVVAASHFGDTSIHLVIRPWCRIEDYWDLRFALPERIKDSLEAAGCSLPCPQRQILMTPPQATLG